MNQEEQVVSPNLILILKSLMRLVQVDQPSKASRVGSNNVVSS